VLGFFKKQIPPKVYFPFLFPSNPNPSGRQKVATNTRGRGIYRGILKGVIFSVESLEFQFNFLNVIPWSEFP